ncbi:glycosyltransferase family 2 protein [Salinisphaera sp. Q1T1-3]|uniref:glycosyltransferase family 2 protein n=1 Tax=Salinisphaera sp. Q1T1-3 TaxID=2321229 RepID=UPI000E729AFC|nr:glycosyltransferase family 2 protein [Salinisphaera sp. Q1T1-3]RJS94738.1 glycosyltransferase family 2 protein [Salinisphaera sp. Q1T1-3]
MTSTHHPHDTPERPLVSFIIPAYNVAAYIEQCLGSLLNETTHDCEVIVVNDGSSDDTGRVAHSHEQDVRLTVIDQPNAGPGAARNTGIERARGRFLMFVDGDDWIEPDTLPVLRQTLGAEPDSDLLVFGFNEVYGTTKWPRQSIADFWRITNSPCNKLFRADLLDGLRFDPTIWYEDLAVVPCLFARARHPVTVERALYNYRRDRQASIMNTIDYARAFDLPYAARLCLERIEQDEANGRIDPTTPRFGSDWQRRFLTIEIFIVGVLHRSRDIADRAERRHYIARMMALIPDRHEIRIDVVQQRYGRKMALGSLFYRYGWDEIAHFVLHDTGAIKRRCAAMLGLDG